MKKGILLQGPISEWTKDIVKDYQKNFSDAAILLSTWNNEKIDDISCETIQIDSPPMPKPYPLTVNHQKKGTLNGLNKISADIIMKCRTDQFILNKNIFKLFEDKCTKNKIMIPNYCTVENVDYFASDFCQIATKDILLEYWNSIPIFDGSFPVDHAETYLAKNYILGGRKDSRPWKICLKEYYCVKGFHEDFQIKWEKLDKHPEPYQRWYNEWYPRCVKPDPYNPLH